MIGAQTQTAAREVGFEAYSLSFAQERLYFLEQLHPGTSQFTISTAVRVTGPLDADRLQRAVDGLVGRHGALRTRFVDHGAGPVQEMLGHAKVRLQLVDLRGRRDADQTRERVLTRLASMGFDLTVAPAMRGALVLLGAEQSVLVLCMHHIICDGVSVDILLRDLVAFYRATDEREPELPELDIDYGDFAEWQRGAVDGEVLDKQLDFWEHELAGTDGRAHLLTDRPRTADPQRRGATVSRAAAPDLGRRLITAAKREGVSPFMLILAAWQLALARTTGRRDFCVGTTVSGREAHQLADVFGCFLNLVAIRSDIAADLTLGSLLGLVRNRCLRAFTNSDVPFEQVVQRINPPRDSGHGPLFDVMLAVQIGRQSRIAFDGLTLTPERLTPAAAQYDAALDVQLDESGVDLTIGYPTSLLSHSTAELLLDRVVGALHAFTEDSSIALSNVAMSVDVGKAEQTSGSTHGPGDPVADHCLAIVQASFEGVPGRHQLLLDDGSVRWPAQTWAAAGRIATRLTEQGVGHGAVVALDASRPHTLAEGCLAIWRAGAAVLPLQPKDPPAWKRRVCASRGANLTVGDDGVSGVPLDGPSTGVASIPPTAALVPADGAISGSVDGITVGAIVRGLAETCGFGPADTIVLGADAHLLDVLSIAVSGATTVVVDGTDRQAVDRAVRAHAATAVWLRTPEWTALLDSGWVPPEGPIAVCDDVAGPRDRLRRGGTALLELMRCGQTRAAIAVTRRDGLGRVSTLVGGMRVSVQDEVGASALPWATGALAIGSADSPTLIPTGDLVRVGEVPEVIGRVDGAVVRHGRVLDLDRAARLVAEQTGTDPSMVRLEVVGTELVGHCERADMGVEVLETAAATVLPSFARPERWAGLDRTPTTAVGAESPSDHVTVAFLDGFRRSLEIPDIGVDDDFFDAGGTSLAAARLVRELSAEVGFQVPVRVLFAHPTVAGLRAALTDAAITPGPMRATDAAEADAVLAIDTTPSGRARTGILQTVVVTGATGFLGAHLVEQVQAACEANVVCLVRAVDADEARRRLGAHFQALALDVDLNRVRCVAADLTRPGLGLSEAGFRALAHEADAVLHSAAAVNFSLPYRSLAAANVEGTRELLRLACTASPSAFHHVSTMDARLGGRLDEVPMPLDRGADDGYVLTKKVAERLVLEASERGLPVDVYRPWLITSSMRTGATNLSDQFALCLAGSLVAGVLPDGLPFPLHVLPADEVARRIVRLVLMAEGGGAIHHLFNEATVRLDQVKVDLEHLGHPMQVMPFPQWRATVARRTAGAMGELSALLALETSETVEPVSVSTDTADRRLGDLSWPQPDRTYLSRTIDFLIASGAVPTASSVPVGAPR